MNPPPQKIVGLKLCWLIFDLNFFSAALSVRQKILIEKETLTTLPNPIYQSWPKPILTYLIPPTPPSLINLTFPAYLAQPDLYYLPFTTKPTQPYILTHGFGVGSKEGHKTEKWQSNHLLSVNTRKSKRFIQSCLIGNKPSICSDSCDDFNINKHK